MARVVVVGGGFAGLSAAVRIAKLRHQVTLVERSNGPILGGRLLGVPGPVAGGDPSIGGQTGQPWYDDPPSVTLPGVFRDLFRKSGRTLDREIDFVPTRPRRHLLDADTVLDLPFGTRGDQVDALVSALGTDVLSPWIDTLADPWNEVRRRALDRVLDPGSPGPGGWFRGDTARSFARRSAASVAAAMPDPRVRGMLLDPLTLAGHDPARTSQVVLFRLYLERNFSRWEFAGGPAALAHVLTARLGQRRVEVCTGIEAIDVDRSAGPPRVVTSNGAVPADIVVWCAPPPASWPVDRRLRPVVPACRTRLLVRPGAGPETDDVMVHLPDPVRIFRCHGDAWTAVHRSADPWPAISAAGIDPDDVIATTTDSPEDVARRGHPGWQWAGWRTTLRRPGVAPRHGLFHAGAHAHPGTGLELAGMATAAIAAAIGPA